MFSAIISSKNVELFFNFSFSNLCLTNFICSTILLSLHKYNLLPEFDDSFSAYCVYFVLVIKNPTVFGGCLCKVAENSLISFGPTEYFSDLYLHWIM